MGEGESALIAGALTGSLALLGVMINAWYGRRLDRDTELRRWRLEQLQPTLDVLNGSLVHFVELDRAYRRLLREPNEDNIAMFLQTAGSEAYVFRHLGHSIVIARDKQHDVSRRLNAAFSAYNACFEDLLSNMKKASVASLLDQPSVSLMPSKENMDQLMNSMLDLNQATERYGFGRVGGRTYAELRDEAARLEEEIARLEADPRSATSFSLLRF